MTDHLQYIDNVPTVMEEGLLAHATMPAHPLCKLDHSRRLGRGDRSHVGRGANALGLHKGEKELRTEIAGGVIA
jgi:hypothetical protein